MTSATAGDTPLMGPLDLAISLDAGQAFRWRWDGAWWRGVLGETALKIRTVYDKLEFASAPADGQEAPHTLADYLALDQDPAVYHAALRDDPLLSRLMDRFPGLRILRQDPWECLVAFLCSAQCSIPRIRRMMDALSDTFGVSLQFDGETLYSFPGPHVLAERTEQELRDLGLGFRAPNVLAAARWVAGGDLELDGLRSLPYEEARDALLELPGVGPKIADCVLLFSFGKGEAFPVDRWVRRAVARLYDFDARAKDQDIAAWARERFGTHAGYAQQLLFHGERERGAARTRSAFRSLPETEH